MMATAANERLNYKAHFLPFQLCRWHSSLHFHYFPFLFFFFIFIFIFSLCLETMSNEILFIRWHTLPHLPGTLGN